MHYSPATSPVLRPAEVSGEGRLRWGRPERTVPSTGPDPGGQHSEEGPGLCPHPCGVRNPDFPKGLPSHLASGGQGKGETMGEHEPGEGRGLHAQPPTLSFSDVGSVAFVGILGSILGCYNVKLSESGKVVRFRPIGCMSPSMPCRRALRVPRPGPVGLDSQGSAGRGMGAHVSLALRALSAGGMQGHDGFLPLLRRVQLLLAVRRGPVPLHPAGGDLLP